MDDTHKFGDDMNKEQLELLSDAYNNYYIITDNFQQEDPIDDLIIKKLRDEMIKITDENGFDDYRLLSQEQFIYKIKTDNNFANKWGVVYEQKELNLEERVKLTIGTDQYRNYTEEQWKDYIETTSIPTRVISITYNNTTIKNYGKL